MYLIWTYTYTNDNDTYLSSEVATVAFSNLKKGYSDMLKYIQRKSWLSVKNVEETGGWSYRFRLEGQSREKWWGIINAKENLAEIK